MVSGGFPVYAVKGNSFTYDANVLRGNINVDIDWGLFWQTIFLGLLSFTIISINLRIYRNPGNSERGHQELLDIFTNDTPEKKQKRLEKHKRIALLWLFLAVIPSTMFLISLLGLFMNH